MNVCVFFKYLRYKFLKKKHFKYKKKYKKQVFTDDTKKYKTGYIQFRKKSDFFLW